MVLVPGVVCMATHNWCTRCEVGTIMFFIIHDESRGDSDCA